MKVLITTDLFTTATNGVVTSVKNLTDELIKNKHEVRILTLSENTHSHKDGNVYYIRSLPFAVYPDVRIPTSFRHPLIKELIEWKPDIIHTQCEFFSFRFAKRISRKTGAPIVHTYHTLYEQYVRYIMPGKRLGHKVVKGLSKKILKPVDVIIVPTNKVETALLSYGIKNKIKVIPSGIDIERHKIRITKEKRNNKRNSLGIEPSTTLFISLGRLGNEKNLDELINYFARALNTVADIKLIIVGDGPARTHLEELTHKLNVDRYVIFTGMVAPAEVQSYYQLGDVFVGASTSETQGLTYVEACANGLPLICRQDPCLTNVLIPGENGFEYTCLDEFIKWTQYVSQNKNWVEKAGKASEKIAQNFSKESFGKAIEKVYLDVLNNRL